MNSVNATDGANKENRGVNIAEEECHELVGDRKDTLRRNLKVVESIARDKMWPYKKFVINADKYPNTFFYNLFIGWWIGCNFHLPCDYDRYWSMDLL